jgi:hypothetical protein
MTLRPIIEERLRMLAIEAGKHDSAMYPAIIAKCSTVEVCCWACFFFSPLTLASK